MAELASAVRSAWRDWAEWTAVFTAIFGADGDACPHAPPATSEEDNDEDGEDAAERRAALQRWKVGAQQLEGWAMRAGSGSLAVPPRALATLEVLQTIIADHDGASSATQCRLAYAMAVVRAVNFVVDPLQTGAYAQSILELASKAGLPRWLVDVRHAATHNRELPSLEMLRIAADAIMRWLLENYWEAQAIKVADAWKGAPLVRRETVRKLQALAAKIANAGEQPDYDEIDDAVDGLIANVPGRLVDTEVVPALVAVLIEEDEHLAYKKDIQRFLLWERVLAGLSDGARSGFAGTLVAALAAVVGGTPEVQSQSPVTQAPPAASKAQKEGALRWMTYLLSKRWHGLSDDSVASKNAEGRSLMDVYPSRWTKAEMDDMLSPAPARLQDRPGLLPALRQAMLVADSWSQRLVGVLLPALVGDTFEAKEAAVVDAVAMLRLKFGKAAPALRHAANANPSLPSLETLENALFGTSEASAWPLEGELESQDQDCSREGSRETGAESEVDQVALADATRQARVEDIVQRAQKRIRVQ